MIEASGTAVEQRTQEHGEIGHLPTSSKMKEAMRSTWMAGDFGKIAQHMTIGAEQFVNRLGIRPGTHVLDVGCGTGNVSIPAARRHARVTGVDIATNLLAQARQRAASEDLTVDFEEGDAQHLKYADNQFDLVTSMFGAMFAPDGDAVAVELARVCKRGGRVAMANWTPKGFSAKISEITDRYVSPPPNASFPLLWGDETIARERLQINGLDVKTAIRTFEFNLRLEPHEVVQLFIEHFGPIKTAFTSMSAIDQESYRRDLTLLWNEHNTSTDGGTCFTSKYLEILAIKV